MRLLPLLLLVLPAAGQNGPPVRILRGELTEWKVGRDGAGELRIRSSDAHVDWCRVTSETYLTRQTLRVSAAGIREGDSLEVVADMSRGPSQCLALTIYVQPPDASARLSYRPLLSLPSSPSTLRDSLFLRGNLTFAGLVQSLERSRLVLKTRNRGSQSFHLRPDTIFSTGGRLVEAGSLQPQTSVFVRAGRGFGGEMEAYQVIWGDILNPR